MLEKIKRMKGLLYRKVKEMEKKEEIELPGFAVKKTAHIIEFPEITDIKKINVIYPLLEPFAYANIKWNDETKELIYYVAEPEMSKEEIDLLKKISDTLIELIEIDLSAIKEPSKVVEYLQKNVAKVIKSLGISLRPLRYVKFMYYIYRNFIGYNQIEPLLQDPNIEDISCDGVNIPIYVVHRKYGSLKTNVVFTDPIELRQFVVKIAERCGRYVSYAEPILDATLPDGSRVAATLASDVATRGATFTIRKFPEKPFSITEQIKLKTTSPEILAYLWYLIERRASILVAGGVATGKTSFLNSICSFIPLEAKIVSIEDTREIKIPHQHWIPNLARVGFGIPMPTGEKYGTITLFDLLKESFRQNPDYLIVGEVRGEETYVMFQGMASGHPSLATFHAGSVDTVMRRLTSPPINLSPTLVESLDVVIVMTYSKEKGKSARRIKEVVEIVGIDPKTGEAKTNVVFRWNPATDEYEKVNESIKVEKFALARGERVEDAFNEIEKRAEIINWIYQKGIEKYEKVTELINLYYKDPSKLEEMIGKPFPKLKPAQKVPIEKPIEAKVVKEKKPEKKRIRSAILSLLGLFGEK
jgi:flagellar protein FlaI